MNYSIDTVDVWAGTVPDRPGGLAQALNKLTEAGANLEFVIARRDKRNRSKVFCAPLKGARQQDAAKQARLSKS